MFTQEQQIAKPRSGCISAVLSAAALALVAAGCGQSSSAAHRTATKASAPLLPAAATTPPSTNPTTQPVPDALARWVIVGHSVKGRPIRAFEAGDPAGARRILVVGCVHGNETAGEAVTRRLRATAPPPGVLIWSIDRFNPDGCAAHTRQNAHGVDLNRNSPWHWRHLSGAFYSGPRPLSEPESRAINTLVRCLQPQVSIWYHQAATLVDDSGGDRAVERRYAHLVGLPFRHFGLEPGSITSWQNATFPSDTAFVVELPAGRLPAASVRRHASAVASLARGISPRPGPASCGRPASPAAQ